MPQYSFDLPNLPSGGKNLENTACEYTGPSGPVCVRDLILYAFFARIADTDNITHEFETKFFPSINTMEIDTPQYVLDFLETIEKGDKLKQFTRWLTGQHQVLKTIILSSAGGWPSITDGATGPTKVEFASGINLWFLDFAAGAIQYVHWTVPMPADWDGGPITVKFYWLSSNASSGYVKWGLQAASVGDDMTINSPWENPEYVLDDFVSQDYLNITQSTPEIIISNDPDLEKFIQFRVVRDGTDDTLNGTARLASVKIEYVGYNIEI